MSSLVNEFLINPVLRQARRFSSNSRHAPSESTVTQEIPDTTHQDAVEDIAQRMGSLGGSKRQDEASDSIFGQPLTSSPIDEGGGLESELEVLETAERSGVLRNQSHHHVETLRLGSLRSDPAPVDDDVSDNPLFGVPDRFRTGSNASSVAPNVAEGTDARDSSSRRTTLDMSPTRRDRQRTGSLPANDGMGALRNKIILIQDMDIPAEQKARRMHKLLTENYNQAQAAYQARAQPVVASPDTMISQERPTELGSLSSYLWQMNGAMDAPVAEQQHTFHLSPEDLERTYAPLEPVENDEDTSEDCEAVPVLGCSHYKRNVKLQCSTCDRWYTCRLCHDEIEDHVLVRHATKNMLCMLCGCAQRAGEFCVECGERTAWYYCDVCKLWDNDSNKSIYHCNDCGICRKGRGLGKDFFHCKNCGVCMKMNVEHSHKCIERVSDCDCPICGEYMFTSTRPVVFMLCGHSIHRTCYYEHLKTSYKCPICNKSTVNMETQFRNLDRAIDSQPMPPQFQDTKAMVSCNDCYAKSAVKYHWLGLKCAVCDSYNTAQLSIISDPAVEVPTIESREAEAPSAADTTMGESAPSAQSIPGPIRHRRHSSHMHLPAPGPGGSRFSPYNLLQRVGRSVSPPRGLGFFGDTMTSGADSDESVDGDDDVDFWGRDEPRSVTSTEHIDVDMEDEEDSDDSVSAVDECDEADGEDEDRFELLGHR